MGSCITMWSFVSCVILSVLSAWLIAQITGQPASMAEGQTNDDLYVQQRESFGRRRGSRGSASSNASQAVSDTPSTDALYQQHQAAMKKSIQDAVAKQPPRVPYFLQVPKLAQPPIQATTTSSKSLEQLYSDLFRPEIHTEPKSKLPDLSIFSELCPPDGFFYSMNPRHSMAIDFVTAAIFAGNSTIQRLNIARGLRDSPHIHPKAWYYALTRVALRDPGLRGIRKPMPAEVIPDSFMSFEALQSAQGQTPGQECILLDGRYGVDNGMENELWYFREDIQLNSHHFHWHLSYPLHSEEREDRRGELFYYAHQSLLARYDADRLSNNLSRVPAISLSPHHAVIDDAYYAHLANAGEFWTDRIENIPFWDVMHKNSSVHQTVHPRNHILEARQRIVESIVGGTIFTSDMREISLLSPRGIDFIGDLIEANNFSLNKAWYAPGPSGLHRSGLMILAHSMDPYFMLNAPPGPVGDIATSLRDVISYRWLTYVNDIFDIHKTSLPPYTPTGGDYQLLWPGIKMVSVSMLPWTGGPPNELHTFWNQKKYRFGSQYPTPVCAKHLDHVEFTYQFVIDNLIGMRVPATIRIFLAPRMNEFGYRFAMLAQRYLFFVMDIFTIDLNQGRNVITRNSTQSAVTTRTPKKNPCGWPHHLLLPKGKPDGMEFDLFVIATKANVVAEPGPAWLLCGDPLKLYPDGYPMGYPFDRSPYQLPNNEGTVPDLDAYLNGITNIGISRVRIFHRTG